MKKPLLLILFLSTGFILFAQDQPTTDSKNKGLLKGRAADHLMIQLGATNWANKPDSIKTKGLSRSLNVYFLFDFPFKSNPHLSIAAGAGVGTDHIFFDKMYVGIKDITPTLQFLNVSDTNHFKKYKLATAWLEAPIEFRYSSNPATPNKSVKVALGIKIGTLLNAHTKGKTWQTSDGKTLIPYTQKENSKRFYNANRFLGTVRLGYGVFSLFGTYQLNTLFKEGFAPDVRPYTIGLTLSGL